MFAAALSALRYRGWTHKCPTLKDLRDEVNRERALLGERSEILDRWRGCSRCRSIIEVLELVADDLEAHPRGDRTG